MIWNSHIWKAELIKELRNFKKYLKQIKFSKYDTEHFVMGLEKFHFLCSFIIRKLVENGKLSDELLSKNYKCGKYQRIQTEKKIDFLNLIDYGEFYDLMNCSNSSLTIKQMCNSFIHSFIFFPTFDEENGMEYTGVFINSDFDKDKHLYHIDYGIIVEMIDDIVKDDIITIQFDRTSGKVRRSKETIEGYIDEEKHGV
ncbi:MULTISPECIES: hypothetical protein [Paenibacillus]|uniref:Uncharacterized protein n=2 Tax=Paenibacillus TaxID=44249 RepID=A0ABX2Z5D7_PAEPO|nr:MULTISPECIES: hypothetical protein [Paenibacillus]APQ60532.1 hypothetical protein VK72_18285 [Paenibacillus polymyxa]MDR6777040.1 hypothetical protein [Paenibacillus peoriae]ODA06430.1 hypothetical protein A7312_16225 [Paenibacillus polymyxa]OME71724.1 hypothetical protein BK119_08910 [Paenibacillus peoriae]VUG05380.1 hypothetical protein PPOLYM_01760 [Paenibacillus polymyxa]